MEEIRFAVRVRPGASRTKVGGSYGDENALIVAVNAPPVDGAANDAVRDALAKTFGIRLRDVTIVSGHTARTKVVAVSVEHDEVERIRARRDELLG